MGNAQVQYMNERCPSQVTIEIAGFAMIMIHEEIYSLEIRSVCFAMKGNGHQQWCVPKSAMSGVQFGARNEHCNCLCWQKCRSLPPSMFARALLGTTFAVLSV